MCASCHAPESFTPEMAWTCRPCKHKARCQRREFTASVTLWARFLAHEMVAQLDTRARESLKASFVPCDFNLFKALHDFVERLPEVQAASVGSITTISGSGGGRVKAWRFTIYDHTTVSHFFDILLPMQDTRQGSAFIADNFSARAVVAPVTFEFSFSVDARHKGKCLAIFSNFLLTSDGVWRWPALDGQPTSYTAEDALSTAFAVRLQLRRLASRRAVHTTLAPFSAVFLASVDTDLSPPASALQA